jgi:mycothiol conjugate amidase Mca
MSKPLTLMVVHAHPDDEAISTGGVFARYSDEGLHTILVTCTRGEEGEIVLPELNTEENHQRLALLRDVELAQAVELLGIKSFYQLGYRDSGMIGTPANNHPECFHMADIEQATGVLVALVRKERPDVLVSYNEQGGYGHPDHIKAHLITVAAFHAAGDAGRFPDKGPAWQPQKLYYTSFKRRVWLTAWEAMRERGLKTPLDDPDFDMGRFQNDDPRITTVVPVLPYLERKLEALRCHRTQISPDFPFFVIPDELRQEFAGHEYFIRVASHVDIPPGAIEDDLFAGLR